MILNDQDWILLYYTNDTELFLEPNDYIHFIKSAQAILERSVRLVYDTFCKTGFYLLLQIEQGKKVVGRDWNAKTNLYISVKNLVIQFCDHFSNTTGSTIETEQLRVCKILNHNWLLGMNQEERNLVADSIIYMNTVGDKSMQNETDYLYHMFQINPEYINSRNIEVYKNNFKSYISKHSQLFSNITL